MRFVLLKFYVKVKLITKLIFMKKTFKKPIVFLPLLMLLIITSLSANKSMFPNVKGITPEIKQIALQFQNLRGSNRIAEFQKLYAKLFNQKAEAVNNKTFSSTKFNANDLEKMFGKADAELQNGEWVYYLNTSKESCKAIIGVDKTVQTIYCTITDCD